MCGKFTQLASWTEVVAFSQALTSTPSDVIVSMPMRDARIIRLGANGKRESVPMRWGFPDTSSKFDRPKHIHARCETIDTLPTFAESFAHRRGILIVQTFNEGEETGAKSKKQWVITPKDGKPIAIAVIWQNYERGVETAPMFVQVTTPTNKLITPITDRMPAILREEDWAAWLGEIPVPLSAAKALLKTFEDDGTLWDVQPQGSPKKPAPPMPRPPTGEPDLFS